MKNIIILGFLLLNTMYTYSQETMPKGDVKGREQLIGDFKTLKFISKEDSILTIKTVLEETICTLDLTRVIVESDYLDLSLRYIKPKSGFSSLLENNLTKLIVLEFYSSKDALLFDEYFEYYVQQLK